MRVIAGRLGGRTFSSPTGHRTHPMSERVRGALFNALGDIEGLTILDAFAGSGALSIEAISRGAAHAVAIDIDKSAHRAILENIRQLGLSQQIKAVRANASGWNENNADKTFDIIICAPPYDDLQLPLITKLVEHMTATGLYVLDWPGNLPPPDLAGLRIAKLLGFGDAQLVFYSKKT